MARLWLPFPVLPIVAILSMIRSGLKPGTCFLQGLKCIEEMKHISVALAEFI